MFLPIGLDESRLARVPWISIGIAAACALAWLLPALSTSDGEAVAEFRQALVYWAERPYLELPDEARQRISLDAEAFRRRWAERGGFAPAPASRALEQEQLDRRIGSALEALEARAERRFALVPARGLAQAGWITHIFLHGGLLHLLGNMLVFLLVVGPFLEDVWGRPFFLAFYLLGGLAAGAAQAIPMSDSPVAVVGASGAISACLGAFAWRFAHRRVRIFYWLFIIARGTFFVPAWLYAVFGAAMDLVGLKASGVQGPVAYGAHVGGFAFGLAVAAVVRLLRLEDRIGPEGATRWAGSMATARAADALAAGRTGEARSRFAEAAAREPGDDEALLELARIDRDRHDVAAAHESLERLLALRLAAGDAAGASALLAEFGSFLRPEGLRPATAYRVAELLEERDPRRAAVFLERAAEAGGDLESKARLRIARLGPARDPRRAVVAEPFAEPRAEPATAPLRADAPAKVRVLGCRLEALDAGGVDLVDGQGRRARLAADRFEAVAVGLVERGDDGRAGILVDLLLRRPTPEGRMVLRVPGRAIALESIHPGMPRPAAFALIVDWLLSGGARPVPDAEAARGRPFARHPDARAFEQACYGRVLAT